MLDTAWRRPSVDHQCAGITTETGVALVAHMRHDGLPIVGIDPPAKMLIDNAPRHACSGCVVAIQIRFAAFGPEAPILKLIRQTRHSLRHRWTGANQDPSWHRRGQNGFSLFRPKTGLSVFCS